jgi:hypothetical protein
MKADKLKTNPVGAPLFAELRRECLILGVVLVFAWLFSGFSYYVSVRTGADWFTRSGSVMCVAGAVGTFRSAMFVQAKLTAALDRGIGLSNELPVMLRPPLRYRAIRHLAYTTGIVGTVVWAYGDLLSHWVSSL